jgi:DNA-binding SARP family transcriptional activator/predicted ATPase
MEYRVLGPLEVREGERSLPLGGAKQRALLAVLLLNANRVVSRERLIDELWGEDPPEQAVATVHVYVSRLRKLLPGRLETRPPGYMLAVEPGELDLDRFERLRAEERWHEALELWRGPPVDELPSERARLEDLRLLVLEERIESDLTNGRHGELVGELTVLIRNHPHRERLRGQLMLALYRAGRQTDALEAYRQARAALDEMGIQPSDQLRRLESAILNQDAALGKAVPSLSATPRLPERLAVEPSSLFVGREREGAMLRALLERATEGHGQVVLIGGEAGAGKSRLVRELACEAVARGTVVLYGGADETVNAAYQPFVEALGLLRRISDIEALLSSVAVGRRELARLLLDSAASPSEPETDPQSARRRLHAAVRDLLTESSRARPLLLIIEDIHWADSPTLQLLRDLARRTPEARVLLVVTHRDRGEEMRPEYVDALAALARVDGLARLTIGGLAVDAVAEFVRSSLDTDADVVSCASAIHSSTDGNPFLLCELWRQLVDTNAVEASGNVVRLSRPLEELASPQGIREVVYGRLSRLSRATTELLELAAVVGAEFELEVLNEVAGESVAKSIEEALASATIEVLPGSRLSFRFSHELVRRALYDRLSALRAARLHLTVGDALEKIYAGKTEKVLTELAHHFTVGAPLGDPARAAEYNLRAAEASAALFDFEQSERLAAKAAELTYEGDIRWAQAQSLLAKAQFHLARGQAEDHAAAAVAAFVRLGDVEAAAGAELIAFDCCANRGRFGEAEAALERALMLVRDRPPSRVKVNALNRWSGTLLIRHCRYREGAAVAREALELAEGLGLTGPRIQALTMVGTALGYLGDGGQGELEHAIELGSSDAAEDGTQIAYTNLATLKYAEGRLLEAERLYVDANDEADRFNLVERAQALTTRRALTAFNLGEWSRADGLIADYFDLPAEAAHSSAESTISIVRTKVALARGDLTTADDLSEQNLSYARASRSGQWLGLGLAVRALVLVEEGRNLEADPLVDELLTLVDEKGTSLWWRWLIDLAWLLHDLNRSERPPFTPYPVWHEPAQAIARRQLSTAAELLGATELVADAMYARMRAAEQLAVQGRGEEAIPHAERALRFYRSFGATAYAARLATLVPAIAPGA